MRVIKIQRGIRKEDNRTGSVSRHSTRQFSRDFFEKENHIEFALEALLFGVLVAVSAWPILVAAGAINELL
ncbi:MAG TPA: hypothetical protein VLK27_00250 [Chthoniobacterales bacterium]|nr:hypothetical protein [Chthoniobacterales bacterium]